MRRNIRVYGVIVAALVATALGAWLVLAPPSPETAAEHARRHFVPAYVCPMHPQVRSDEPGNCPICGMQLVRERPPGEAARGERRVLYWYDPMRPDVRFDRPGKSPFMDMELVPKYADEADAGIVTIDPRMAQNLGVRTARVERGTFVRRLEAVGAVVVDERRIHVVESRVAGWVERLEVRAAGDPVKRDAPLAGVYAPELLAAQQELLLARASDDATLASAARERLLLLGMPAAEIEAVLAEGKARRQVSLVAPVSGVVIELNAREGMQVAPGMPLFRIADLSRVWVEIEVPEAQAAWLRPGAAAEARLPALPGEVLRGRIEYVYPALDVMARTARARLTFDNPRLALKPGMYADVSLAGDERQDVLLVPTEAVIRTGTRSVVILAEGAGRFRPAEVVTGDESGDRTEILRGLAPGEHVVVSGQFLIDSEANLRAALARLAPPVPAGGNGAGHDHEHGHDHDAGGAP